MHDFCRSLLFHGRLRGTVACAFLLLLLAEWSSHLLVHIGTHSRLASSVSSDRGTVEDPCHSFVHCDDGRHRDRQMPNPGHDLTPNLLVDLLPDLDPPVHLNDNTPIQELPADALSRPPDPAFHPPELS